MIRLHMVVEGQTEEEFVNSVLKEHLAGFSIFVDARCVETSRSRRRRRIYRGGMIDYLKAKRDLHRWMKEDQHPEVFFTTMFDLYALPGDFPKREESRPLTDPYARVQMLEEEFRKDIGHQSFVPYLQLHEFEALVLTDPQKLDIEFMNRTLEISRLVEMRAAVDSPEVIDDGENTAPSKRIIAEIPEYEGRKVSAGPRVARDIGLAILRKGCPHFHAWLNRLECLGST